MDQSITTLTLPQRWGFSFSLSLMAWVLPITLKAPPLVILICLMGAIAGFGACIFISGQWYGESRHRRKMDAYHEELENYQLALDEEATKREMVTLTFGSVSSGNSEPAPDLAPVPVRESLPHPPSGHSSDLGSGSVQTPNPANRLYTAQNLTFEAAADLISRLALTMTQTQIIEGLWGVKKGSSKAYKNAAEEFKTLTQ